MRKFSFNLFYFSIIPFLIFGVIEICIYQLRLRLFSEKKLESIYSGKTNAYEWIKSIKSDSIIFLAGSSSVKYGLSCKILNNMSTENCKYVNIASDARDPLETYFLIKKLNLNNVSEIYFGLDPWIYTKSYYFYRDRFHCLKQYSHSHCLLLQHCPLAAPCHSVHHKRFHRPRKCGCCLL